MRQRAHLDLDRLPVRSCDSVKIARSWEVAQEQAATPDTRKIALGSAMVMSPDRGGVFDGYPQWQTAAANLALRRRRG